MFRQVGDLSLFFGNKPSVKLNQVYNVLCTQLNENLKVEDLKNFNHYIINRFQATEMDEDVTFLDVDESVINKEMLESALGQNQNKTVGSR
jgi:hypothetical protein